MKRIVLDASVSAAWCLPDETNAASERYLRFLVKGEAVVPAVWVSEMANVLVTAERRKRISAEVAEAAFELLGRLPIHVEAADVTALTQIRATAIDHGISADDASYLDLARMHELPLATFDRPLREAARKAGVTLA